MFSRWTRRGGWGDAAIKFVTHVCGSLEVPPDVFFRPISSSLQQFNAESLVLLASTTSSVKASTLVNILAPVSNVEMFRVEELVEDGCE